MNEHQRNDTKAEDVPARRAEAWLMRCLANEVTPTDQRNLRRFILGVLAWSVLIFLDPEHLGGVEGQTSAASLVLGAVVVVATFAVIAAFARFIQQTDELNRKIAQHSLGVGFAAAVVATIAGEAAIDAGLVASVEPDIIMAFMTVVFSISTVRQSERYRA